VAVLLEPEMALRAERDQVVVDIVPEQRPRDEMVSRHRPVPDVADTAGVLALELLQARPVVDLARTLSSPGHLVAGNY